MTRYFWKSTVVSVAILSVLHTFPIANATTVLGTARGVRSAKLSMDGGKTWLTVGPRSLPVIEGSEIRSASGIVMLYLSDGSRVTVMPFSALRFTESDGVTELALRYGRLTFRLPERTRVQIATPSARLEPMRQQPMAGELMVGGVELTGLKMTEGTLRVQPRAASARTMVASLDPVFIPEQPKAAGSFFSSDTPTKAPVNAKAVFTASGESVGYLGPDGGLVIAPGFTENLTGAVPSKLVQLAMADIPTNHATDAVPLFDVNGGRQGYLLGPVYYAQLQTEVPTAPPAARSAAFGGLSRAAKIWIASIAGVVAVLALGIGLGGGGGGGGGGEESPPPGTQISP